MTLRHIGTAAGGAPSAPGWVQKYTVDWTAETTHNLLTGGAYTDSAGVSWDIGDGTIEGNGHASVMLNTNGSGLLITTSGTGDIVLGQTMDAILGDFDMQADRLAIIIDGSSANQTVAYQNVWLQYGRGGLNWTDGTHRLWRTYDPKTVQKIKQDSPGNFSSNTVTVDAAAARDVLGFDVVRDSARPYYGDSFPSEPFTGLSAGNIQTMIRKPDSTDAPFTEAEASIGLYVNRNGGTNFSYLWKSLTVWRWE